MRDVHSLSQLQSVDVSARFEASRQAVQAIGTNALPFLLDWMQARDSGSGIAWADGYLPFGAPGRSALEKHAMAQAGFMILQKEARPAVPALIQLTKDDNPGVRMRAFDSLMLVMGADAKSLVPILVPFGHDPDAGNRARAAQYMQWLTPLLAPGEAETDGVYEAFPELRTESAPTQ